MLQLNDSMEPESPGAAILHPAETEVGMEAALHLLWTNEVVQSAAGMRGPRQKLNGTVIRPMRRKRESLLLLKTGRRTDPGAPLQTTAQTWGFGQNGDSETDNMDSRNGSFL
ncbi:unnamed protein product [Pleuronectes platessa]|uniref:Uncharacterized protein n=1 Tax=Pleuronectes platessa TaxID=8262 RepID=A0A9N7YWH2_PLEPL|nr:unnamed protein product [Pleuronectes platessa]